LPGSAGNNLPIRFSEPNNLRYNESGKRFPFLSSKTPISKPSNVGSTALGTGLGIAAAGIPGAIASGIGAVGNFIQNQQNLDFQKQTYSDTVQAAKLHNLPHPGLGLSGAYMSGMNVYRKGSVLSHSRATPPPGTNSSPIWGNSFN
jgi:hypothetical protein